MKGLFIKIKNGPTRRRFVVSTIRKDEDFFETAIFAANFFYLPRNWSRPEIIVKTATQEEAWETHYRLADRLLKEIPVRIFQEYD